MAYKKSKKKSQQTKGRADKLENHDIEVEELALALLINTRTRRLLHPYLITQDTENQTAFLKILAMLLIYDGKLVDEIADETLGENAPFVKMYARALGELIDEDVAAVKQYGCDLGHS